MKYTRQGSIVLWNGVTALPDTIHVVHSSSHLAEFELLSSICGLHGHVTAFDVLTGADSGTEKDADLTAVQEAFQAFLAPRMPLTRYDSADKRVDTSDKRVQAAQAQHAQHAQHALKRTSFTLESRAALSTDT
jgi:hypothetical protein